MSAKLAALPLVGLCLLVIAILPSYSGASVFSASARGHDAISPAGSQSGSAAPDFAWRKKPKKARLSGPKVVRPGKKVTFRARGLPANKAFYVRVDAKIFRPPTDGLDGKYIQKEFTSDSHGRAIIKFRFPRRRTQCGFSCAAGSVAWKKGSKARIGVWVGRRLAAFRFSRIARK